MPDIEVSDLEQKALMWERKSYTGTREPILIPPVELSVRWNWRKATRLAPDGGTVGWDVTVITTQDIPNDSILWQGSFDTVPGGEAAPLPVSDLYIVVERNITPDLKNRSTRWEIKAKRFNNTLPTVIQPPLISAINPTEPALIEGGTESTQFTFDNDGGDIGSYLWEVRNSGDLVWSTFSTSANPTLTFAELDNIAEISEETYDIRLTATNLAGSSTDIAIECLSATSL